MKNKTYFLQTTSHFSSQLKKLAKSLPRQKIEHAFFVLANNPFHVQLKTHKVQSRKNGLAYSSSVTGDIRIIWQLNSSESSILLLDIGSHSGSHKVYK